jgi:dUTP pyrophosphatase
MTFIKVKKAHPKARLPLRNNPTDAGADLFAVEDTVIPPLSRAVINTGIIVELPEPNTYLRVAPRSGLAVKQGIDVFAGVIDHGYRGVVGVVLYNSDKDKSFEIKQGDRIAQLIVEYCQSLDFVETDETSDTSRSENGFGSSGIK